VFEGTVSTARFGSFGHVWRLGNDDHAAAAPGQKLAVKTPKPVTEPAGDDASATRANELLRWEARTPLGPLTLPFITRCHITHLL